MSDGFDINGALAKLDRILALEDSFSLEHMRSETAKNLQAVRIKLLEYVSDIGNKKNLSLILSTEKNILQGDLDRYSNSKEMAASLRNALIEFDSAERHLQLVQDKNEYNYVNLAHSLPKRRRAGLPLDEARQAFDSHAVRLSNLNKARLDAEEKLIINARKQNVDKARSIYIEQQKAALKIKKLSNQ